MLRRSFVSGLAALIATPALVKASDLMAFPRRPVLWGDGLHDDTAALQWILDNPEYGCVRIPAGFFTVRKELVVSSRAEKIFGPGSLIKREGPLGGAVLRFVAMPEDRTRFVDSLRIDMQGSKADYAIKFDSSPGGFFGSHIDYRC